MTKQVPLAEHEEMDRWKKLPTWAQQELEHWRVDEAHQRGRAEEAESNRDEWKMRAEKAEALLEAADSFRYTGPNGTFWAENNGSTTSRLPGWFVGLGAHHESLFFDPPDARDQAIAEARRRAGLETK